MVPINHGVKVNNRVNGLTCVSSDEKMHFYGFQGGWAFSIENREIKKNWKISCLELYCSVLWLR